MPSHSAVTQVRNLLDANAHSYRNIVMVGRTHLQLISWVAQLNERWPEFDKLFREFSRWSPGGTEVCTGINAHSRFGEVAAVGSLKRSVNHLCLQRTTSRHGLRTTWAERAQAGGRIDEDRQRRSLVCQWSKGRDRGTQNSGKRTWLVHHAGQD